MKKALLIGFIGIVADGLSAADSGLKDQLAKAARQLGEKPNFWIKDGALTKYEINVQGKVSAGERTFDINRTLSVEIKDVGSTKLEVPAEAKAKIS